MGNRRETNEKKKRVRSPKATRFFAAWSALLSDQEGQAIIEYILILATVIGAGYMSRKILETIDKGILTLGGQLEKDLKTGRLPLNVWKN